MKKQKIDNAIILAAGFSSRFVPLCFDIPKGLLLVKGETLIERQIRQLKEVGVIDITIITGAYAEQFDFLKKKHNVSLIYNPDFKTKNNFASLYAARSILGNTLISSADLFFQNNIFTSTIEKPYYASIFVNGETSQRCLTIDQEDKIIATHYNGENTWITFGGHAVLTKDISQKLINLIEPVYNNLDYANKYWVDFQDDNLSMLPMYIKRLNKNDIVEFNTLESLKKFDPSFNELLFSQSMRTICYKLNCQANELQSFMPIKEANFAIGCSFYFKNQQYTYIHKTNQLEAIL